MGTATPFQLDSAPGHPGPELPPPGDDAQLQEALKYCAPSTYEAARQFRMTGRPEHLVPIVHGILARYVEPERRAQLAPPDENIRLREDLGLDSLSLMEAVIRIEEVLEISVRDEDLREFRTVGEVRALIDRSVTASPARALPRSASGSRH